MVVARSHEVAADLLFLEAAQPRGNRLSQNTGDAIDQPTRRARDPDDTLEVSKP